MKGGYIITTRMIDVFNTHSLYIIILSLILLVGGFSTITYAAAGNSTQEKIKTEFLALQTPYFQEISLSARHWFS